VPTPLMDYAEGFDWQEWIREKIIIKHSVQPQEVEECFYESVYKMKRSRNNTYELFSRSQAGRYLAIAFVWNQRSIRIITARDMSKKERDYYHRK